MRIDYAKTPYPYHAHMPISSRGIMGCVRNGVDDTMMHPEGSILAQVQDIVTEEMKLLFNGYLQIEKGTYFSSNLWITHGGFKEKERHIQMCCDAAIRVKCGHLMKAIRRYEECPQCGGMGSYAGYNTYEWCTHCNCFQEVEV